MRSTCFATTASHHTPHPALNTVVYTGHVCSVFYAVEQLQTIRFWTRSEAVMLLLLAAP